MNIKKKTFFRNKTGSKKNFNMNIEKFEKKNIKSSFIISCSFFFFLKNNVSKKLISNIKLKKKKKEERGFI